MDVKDLVFFNKEGYQMNLNHDADTDMWSGKMFFDKNSVDTFKTQGIYLFEKVYGTNNTFQAYLDKFQVFNTNGFRTYPKYDARASFEVTSIINVNSSSAYNTKWVYATDIHKEFYPGMWFYFTGLNGWSGTDFDTTVAGELQLFKVFAVEQNRILVWSATNNATAVPSSLPLSPAPTAVAVDVIEVQQLAPEPLWNETSLNSKIYADKKISMVANSDNDGVYTIGDVTMTHPREYLTMSPTLFIPAAGDTLRLSIALNTSNIPIANGVVIFANGGPTFITLPYIPSYVKIGDQIQAEPKLVALSGFNTAAFTISDIDRTTNTLTITGTATSQTVDCYIYFASNVFVIDQEIVLDNNNTYSLPLTYWTIVNKWGETLRNMPGGVRLKYDTSTDELHVISDYTQSYFTISALVIHANSTTTSLGVIAPATYTVYPLFVSEALQSEDIIDSDSTRYERQIIFNTIDSFGLNMKINGIAYGVDFDTDVNNTVADFVSQFSTGLALIGITIAQTTTTSLGDTLTITGDYPNLPVFTQMNMGDFSDYYVQYRTIQFNNIKSQLLITVDDQQYSVPFNTDDNTTVSDWVSAHANVLRTFNILVTNVTNTIYFNLLDPEKTLNITYNIGYVPKSGDLSVYDTLYATPATGSVIAGNEVKIVTGTYNFTSFYSTGQKISINGAAMTPQNRSYNIVGLADDTLSLSYQGAFWQQGLPVFDLNIVSDYFIRFPKSGVTGYSNPATMLWTWKDTQIKDYFFYDFTGTQLRPAYDNFPEYNGITPLCGENGEIQLRLIDKPNTDLAAISDPTKQQTVFDSIEYTLPFLDDPTLATMEPAPMQVFIGYKADFESWSKARIYLELREDVSFSRTTTIPTPGNYDDLWVFDGNSLELQNVVAPFDFAILGFRPGQVVEISSKDISPDNKSVATLDNNGKKYVIDQVFANRIVFKTDLYSETSVKNLPSVTPPYYDAFGNPMLADRPLRVSITVVPKVIAYFDVYGESEEEDVRHKINLNNRNKNILKLQDVFIFKEVDINEDGIDWVFLNRKRKELIEIYPEIFNNIASYKSVIQAINFFGYNDLTFSEYFQNIDPESKNFGHLFNIELLNIFNKTVGGWQYSNLAFDNLRNSGYRKTNLFSLNYKITDVEGNFINAYSLDEVRVKLLGLKRWLTENIIPIGTKITDINGKYQMPQKFLLQHDTYMTRNFRVEEYCAPVDFKVTGYLQPISVGSHTYNIGVEFFSAADIEWFEYRIRTFYLEQWSPTLTYMANSKVYNNGFAWTNSAATLAGDEPGVTNSWTKTSIDQLPNVQILKDYGWNASTTSLSVNDMVDPHFVVEVSWHSGHATAYKTKKTYSVIPGFFDELTD